MATLRQLVDEVLTNLMSYGLSQPRVTTLASDALIDDTVLNLTGIAGIGPGLAELGDERLIVNLVNNGATPVSGAGSGTVTVLRGYLTDASAHSMGEIFTANPVWPRVSIANAINDAITNAYPTLFGVHDTTFDASVVANTYDLDTLDDEVLTVRTLSLGPSGEWMLLNNWRYDSDLRKLTLFDNVVFNQPVKIITQRRLVQIGLDDELTVSGLRDSARKYVVQQAQAYLVVNMDSARLPNYASAPNAFTPYRSVGSGVPIAQQLYQMAGMELERERSRLLQTYRPSIIYSTRGGFYH